MVGDPEEEPHVRILPARPIHDEREYAGREENNDFIHIDKSSYFVVFSSGLSWFVTVLLVAQWAENE